MGPLGAAIATAISYLIVWGIRLKHAKQYVQLQINLKRDIFTYIILIVESIILFVIKNVIIMYILEVITVILLVICYKIEIQGILNKVLYRKE